MAGNETASMRRRRYESKRNLAASPEPSWKSRQPGARRKGTGRLFVIHKHAARRLHYDLRLEIDGALASWAVPKGFPANQGEKHLAIKVEDHPLDYGDFEGNIPAGNYGAGAVMLWDRGLYEVLEKNPAEAVRNGRLSIVFAGDKLRGEWILVRTRQAGDKEQWLLLKGKENDWRLAAKEDDRSVASGRSLAQIKAEAEENPSASAPTRAAASKGKPGTKRKSDRNNLHPALKKLPSAAPSFLAPMKPYLSAHLPKEGEWIYEIKFDGYRVVSVKEGHETTLFSRNQKDVSRDFSDIRDAIAALPVSSLVLDGEVVALLDSGVSSFQLLQNHARSGQKQGKPLYYYAFDLLNLDGRDTTGLPLHLRKQLLQELFAGAADPLRFSAGIESDPESFLAQAEKLGLEGLIAKEAEGSYQIGRRARSWLKIKLHHEQEFVIGGYTKPKGTRTHFGSLIVGVYQGRELHYVGRVGTGFDEKTLTSAHRKFQPLRTPECPFANLPTPRKKSFGGGLTATDIKTCTWLKPKLVCQVRFSEWTGDDSIRHPVFLGFRDDKKPREVKREKPLPS